MKIIGQLVDRTERLRQENSFLQKGAMAGASADEPSAATKLKLIGRLVAQAEALRASVAAQKAATGQGTSAAAKAGSMDLKMKVIQQLMAKRTALRVAEGASVGADTVGADAGALRVGARAARS